MKTYIKKLFLLPALIAALGLTLTGRVTAQTFKTLHSFTNSPDGVNPGAGLILSGNTLYGTAEFGGSSGPGMVFKLNTDGSGFTNLYSCPNNSTAGYEPVAGLILSGNILYGTTEYGASYPDDGGTVFAVN